jgi:2-oxoglutarate ferredoxin oxidoreductase subunit beta
MCTESSDFDRKGIEPVWCPGCGHYSVLKAVKSTFSYLSIEPEKVVIVSGIGCSGRFSHYLNTYSLHGTHGRALPTATGVKTARPDLTVLVVGGDGDAFGIGGGHIVHAARRNVDVTYLILDNQTYGLTKGQASPTTPLDNRTKTSPYGTYEEALEPIPILLSYGISFVARTSSVDISEMTKITIGALEHRGLSVVHILSPCRTFPVLDGKSLKRLLEPLPSDYDPSNRAAALKIGYSTDPLYTGVFYKIQKPTLEERLEAQSEAAKKQYAINDERASLEKILEEFV